MTQITNSFRKTKAETAAEMLEAAIVNCDLEPGSIVAEADLMELLDLGRTPVREALVRLSSENLVRLGRAGILIPELNAMTMLKLLELREPIERLSIEKAVQRHNSADMERFAQILAQLEPLPNTDRTGFMDLLRQIHAALAEASKNEFILSTMKTTQGLSRRFWRYYSTDEDQQFCTELYCALLQGLLSGDAAVPIKKSSELMTYLRVFTQRQMEALV
ncbi:GntR family transcriptional regulator [Marinovum sp. 2_MG-2023]|uniref:GntR family transcriptional regulator n=1 Tax=unclassified Marinovum TaxID=2647166 RepID=UPI0026E37FCB|nr:MULTISPECIES: GntR family transcriptional regulator [unclassified Marinovum]MDO6732831.1 GntR family transcriptional regulator [Marinovum sp. 2_MG-2023]MDO6782103.1 GntR family transcriptional regulator [Marinovum sp. 1_MG-2023]